MLEPCARLDDSRRLDHPQKKATAAARTCRLPLSPFLSLFAFVFVSQPQHQSSSSRRARLAGPAAIQSRPRRPEAYMLY